MNNQVGDSTMKKEILEKKIPQEVTFFKKRGTQYKNVEVKGKTGILDRAVNMFKYGKVKYSTANNEPMYVKKQKIKM